MESPGIAHLYTVVNIAAEFDDGFGRRVHHSHVPDFELANQLIAQAAVETGHAAVVAGRFLAFADQRLSGLFNGLVARRAAHVLVNARRTLSVPSSMDSVT